MQRNLPILAALVLVVCCGIARAEVRLPALFNDNMVLQHSTGVPIWGWAAPGEEVTIRFGEQSARCVTDGRGKWRATLDLSHASSAPGEMIVTGSRTPAPRTIKNVIVGEVWLASGQSNMEKPLGPHVGQHPVDHWEQEVAASANPQIRVFTVTPKASAKPLDDCLGKWEVASPQTTAHFTAAGYFFARELNKTLQTPVGMIHSSWGGTRVEAWTSAQGSAADPELASLAKEEIAVHDEYPRALQQYRAQVADWAKAHHCEDPGNAGEKAGWARPQANTDDWQSINMGSGKKGSIPAGIRWYRKTITIPPQWKDHPAYLSLGAINGIDTAYFNGTRIGGLDPHMPERIGGARMYLIPGPLMQPGPAVIAIRVMSYLPGNQPVNQAYRMAIACVGNQGLGGPWIYKDELTFPAADGAALSSFPTPPAGVPDFDTASFLFNGMIHPLIPYRLAGVIWYQGESNASPSQWVQTMHPKSPSYTGAHPDPAGLYLKAFPAMINDWRAQWEQLGGQSTFPFDYCQIANYGKKTDQPSDSQWAEVRDAQRRTLAIVPDTGMAVLIDIGMAKDIHPTNKQEVGHRLALLALAHTYGRQIESSGPLYQSIAIEGNRVRVRFTHVADGLIAKPLPDTYQPRTYEPATVPLVKPMPGSPLQGFEIRGADGKWVWADASIQGAEVIVSSPKVPAPVAVRYAWSDNPTCNLYNSTGLPASPFRSDD